MMHAPAWNTRRAMLRPACSIVQSRPFDWRCALDGAAFIAATVAACIGILALGAILE